MEIVVACLDVGSVKRNSVGWAVIKGERANVGSSLVEFVDLIVSHLNSGEKVALGFECPLYLPCRTVPEELTSKRINENYLTWSGGPGPGVLATGLVQVRWLLNIISVRASNTRATTRWYEFKDDGRNLFVWEAFITSKDGERPDLQQYGLSDLPDHQDDALSGAHTFLTRAGGPEPLTSDLGEEPSMSLIGWHLISTGLASDLSLANETCLVIKTRKRE